MKSVTGMKMSFYFPAAMHDAIKREAERQDRSFSWVLRRAWVIARAQMERLPDAQGEANRGE